MGQVLEKEDHTQRGDAGAQPTVSSFPDRSGDAGTLESYRAELADYRHRFAHLADEDPGQVMILLSGCAGRLAEIRSELFTMGTRNADALRTKHLDPLRKDLDFHFQAYSRQLSFMEWELKMSGGQV